MDREPEAMAGREPADDEAGYRGLVDAIDDCGLIRLDPEGRVLTWSRGAERITGEPAADRIGRPMPAPDDPDGAPPNGGFRAWRRRGWLTRPDGSRFWAEVTTTPIRGPNHEPIGFAVVIRDQTESGRRERTLEDEVRRLTRASRRKDDLLALLAHQMRNPLSPIRNGLHLLRRGDGDAGLVAELHELIDRQVDRLVRIVDDVLELSRLSRGLVELDRQPVDLRQVAREAAEARGGDAGRAGVALESSFPPAPVWVRGEAPRLRRAVEALLENAVRHTARGGSVTIEVVADDRERRAALLIRDNGVGLTPDLLAVLQRAIDGVDGTHAPDPGRGRGRLGLGLEVARGIVALHGGAVRARSEGPGRGAEFAVVLPIVDLAVAATAPVPAPSPSAPTLRILVVEDNADAAESLRRLLRLHGHEVRVADNGIDGVAEARRCHPDAVVCDIGLPGMDGYAVATALRRDPETARARLIAVTGYGRAEDRDRALSSGFDDHIVKPADPAVLLSKLVVSP